jgi:hypothetical protein
LLLPACPWAAKALAHKASQAGAAVLPAARTPAPRIDTEPASPLGEASGRSLHEAAAADGMKPSTTSAKSNVISARINRRH